MSLPFVHLHCIECDFKSSTTVMWGACSYDHDGNKIRINRAIGWCNSCADFAPIEKLPTQKSVAELRAKIDQAEGRVRSAELMAGASRSWYKRLFNIEAELPSEMRKLAFDILNQKKELEREIERARILSDRRSPPRCLKCGSTESETLQQNFNQYPKAGEQGFVLDFAHPNCGGEIWAEPSRFRVSIAPEHKLFDIEGRYLGLLDEEKAR